jgi:hypothetical protein
MNCPYTFLQAYSLGGVELPTGPKAFIDRPNAGLINQATTDMEVGVRFIEPELSHNIPS